VTAEASEMVTVPRAELDALRAEVRRLRREAGRTVARARMEADPGPEGSLSRGLTIAAGTSEIIRTQIAERVLGLPRD
jgi:hypothetical protein